MKTRRLSYKYRASASKLHKRVGEILRNKSPWKGFKIYQEYPVNKINDSWKSGREKFDWVILDLNLVIECHGEQHYGPVAFDGDQEKAKERYKKQVRVDLEKQNAAVQAGFDYIIVRYDCENIQKYLLAMVK